MTIAIPVFRDLAPAPQRNVVRIPPALVAAVRWDYEYGLMAQGDLVAKYRLVLSESSVRGIASGRRHPEVKARRQALAWCKNSWRLKK